MIEVSKGVLYNFFIRCRVGRNRHSQKESTILPVLHKKVEKIINIKTLAVMYALSVFYQGYWWAIFVGYNFARLKSFLGTAFEATIFGKIVAFVVVSILLMAAWTSLKLAVVAIRLARLASDSSAKFHQTGKQKWHMLLGIGCVMVPLLTIMFLDPIKGEDGIRAYLASHISLALIFGYSLFAIQLYEGWPKRRY